MDHLVEHTGEEATQEWASNVSKGVNDAGSWGIWEHRWVSLSLEKWLNETNSWVDASTSDSASHSDSKVESESNAVSVDLEGLSTVVVLDHEDERSEHEGAKGLADENLEHHASAVVAAMGWAKLGSVVSTKNLGGIALFNIAEAHSADECSDESTNTLSGDDHHGEKFVVGETFFAFLDEDSHGHSWIKMSPANLSENLNANSNDETDALWSSSWYSAPVNSDDDAGCTECFGKQNALFVQMSTFDFHFLY